MADTKITGLTVGVPVGTDVIPYVSSPGASPITKKTLVSDLRGYSLEAGMSGASPSDATTLYFGLFRTTSFTATVTDRKIYVPKAGTITRVDIHQLVATVLGTTETSTMYLRLNNTTDTTLSAAINMSSAAAQYNVTGLSIAVVAGDWFNIKWITPTWATNPTGISLAAQIWVE